MAIGLITAERDILRRAPAPAIGDDPEVTISAREISAALRLRKLQQQQAERRRATGGELAAPASILALFG